MPMKILVVLLSTICISFPAFSDTPCEEKSCPMEESMPVTNAMDFPVKWGGYYTYKNEDGKYSIFRLLDLNADAIHYALFSEDFDSRPSASKVKSMTPFIGHVPIAIGSLLYKSEIEVTAHTPLTNDDLDGYAYYLGEFGVEGDELSELKSKLIEFSHKEPLLIHLKMNGDEVEVSVK